MSDAHRQKGRIDVESTTKDAVTLVTGATRASPYSSLQGRGHGSETERWLRVGGFDARFVRLDVTDLDRE